MKPLPTGGGALLMRVHPRAGVGIETFVLLFLFRGIWVHPRAGVGIETTGAGANGKGVLLVHPRAGVGIETHSLVVGACPRRTGMKMIELVVSTDMM